MILIKDRHRNLLNLNRALNRFGKYDTYKGSTHIRIIRILFFRPRGNMILIKDRHFSPLYKFTYALFGKYDPYKGSTQSNANPFQDSSSGKYDIDKG